MTHHISNQGTDHLISQTLKITLKSSELEGGGGQANSLKQDRGPIRQRTQNRPVRPVVPTGLTSATTMRRPKMLKPKNPEADQWKVVKTKVKGKNESFKPTFDYLLFKYVNQRTVLKNQSSKGSATPSLKHDRSFSHRSGRVSNVIKVGSMKVTINDQVNNKALDHEASNKSLTLKHVPPRWCPPGLSHSQKRILQ
jgi:hypothetical protein